MQEARFSQRASSHSKINFICQPTRLGWTLTVIMSSISEVVRGRQEEGNCAFAPLATTV